MTTFHKFKAFVPVLCLLVVFTTYIPLCECDDYQPQEQQQQQHNQQSNNGYSSPSTTPFVQHHRNRNHHTRATGYPTESRTGIVVPLFLPMILFVGIVLLLFFAVVGSAAVAGSAAGIGRRGVPARFSRDFSSSAALARDVLSSEQCVERISCEVFQVAKGYSAQNWMLRALSLLPEQNDWAKRVSRTLSAQRKLMRQRRSRKENCFNFQCSAVSAFVQTVKKLKTE